MIYVYSLMLLRLCTFVGCKLGMLVGRHFGCDVSLGEVGLGWYFSLF